MDGQIANVSLNHVNSINTARTILAVGSVLALDKSINKGKASVYEWNGSSLIQRDSDI